MLVKLFFGQWALSILFLELVILKKFKPLKDKTTNPELHKRYHAYERLDVGEWDKNRPLLWVMASLALIRFAVMIGITLVLFIFVWLITLQIPRGKKIPKRMQKLLIFLGNTVARVILLVFVFLYKIDVKYVDYDYTEFLGPGYKKEQEESFVSTVVANHSSIIDTCMHCMFGVPSFISKEEIKKIPFIGPIVQKVGGHFINRNASSQKDRENAIINIVHRQQQCKDGVSPPLIIHPEGGTSNGKYVTQFKKGSFIGLQPILPVSMKWSSGIFSVTSDIAPQLYLLFAMAYIPYCSLSMKRLPLFVPNDYFFQNHQQKGEEKWQTFARVIRQLIADQHDLELSELSLADKLAYKKLVFSKDSKKSQ